MKHYKEIEPESKYIIIRILNNNNNINNTDVWLIHNMYDYWYIQRSVIDSTLNLQVTINNEGFAQDILEKLSSKDDLMSLRKFVIESEQVFGNDYPKLLKDLFNAVYKSTLPEDKKRLALLQVSESLYRSALVMDQEINFFSCLINLSAL